MESLEVNDAAELEGHTSIDVWSLGAILYELCTGQTLFRQDINDDKIVSQADKKRLRAWIGISDDELDDVFPEEQDATVREDAKALIRWCLMGDPALRPSLEQILMHRFLKPEDGSAQPLGEATDPAPPGVPVDTPIRVPDQIRMRYHAMITHYAHYQAEASGDTGALAAALRSAGMHVWRDVDMANLTLAGMCQGVMDSDILIVMLTTAVLSRWFCLKEIEFALLFGKQIVFVQETEDRFWPWDNERWRADRCTRDLWPHDQEWKDSKQIFTDTRALTFERCQADFPMVVEELTRQVQNNMLIPYRRRDFERDGMMVPEIMRRAASASPLYGPRPLSWGTVIKPAVPSVMSSANIFIIYNTASGEEIKQSMQTVLESCCNNVWSSSDQPAHIDTATHFVVLLTEEAVTPGQESLEQLQDALVLNRPIEYIFQAPFFEEHICKAPDAVKEELNNKEALQYRALAYENEVMCQEILSRLHRASSGHMPQHGQQPHAGTNPKPSHKPCILAYINRTCNLFPDQNHHLSTRTQGRRFNML